MFKKKIMLYFSPDVARSPVVGGRRLGGERGQTPLQTAVQRHGQLHQQDKHHLEGNLVVMLSVFIFGT